MKWNHPPPTWNATSNWLAWFLPSTVSVNFDVSRYKLLGEFSLREQPSCSVPWCECSVLGYTHQVEGRSVAWISFVGNESSKSQCFVVFFWISHVFSQKSQVFPWKSCTEHGFTQLQMQLDHHLKVALLQGSLLCFWCIYSSELW